MTGGRVYHVWDILREFLGHNYVSAFHTLKPKNFFLKQRCFSSPGPVQQAPSYNARLQFWRQLLQHISTVK